MAAIYWFSSNYTNTSNLTLLSIFQVCLCERVLRQNAAELSWVDASPPPAPLAHPASSYYKRKYFLAGHMPFIDFSLFALLDLTDQMGHLMLVMEKKENKNKTRLGQFMDLSVFTDIMFSVQQGASLWERGYSVRLGVVWCTRNHT